MANPLATVIMSNISKKVVTDKSFKVCESNLIKVENINKNEEELLKSILNKNMKQSIKQTECKKPLMRSLEDLCKKDNNTNKEIPKKNISKSKAMVRLEDLIK
jgi:hypothetical protein